MNPMRLFTLSSYSDLIPGMIIAQNLHHPAVFIREGLIDERICSGDLVVRFLDTLEEANTLFSSSINDIVCLGALSSGQSVLLQIKAWDALASQLTPHPCRRPCSQQQTPRQGTTPRKQSLALSLLAIAQPLLNHRSTLSQPSQTHP